jgi:hypothetical protein
VDWLAEVNVLEKRAVSIFSPKDGCVLTGNLRQYEHNVTKGHRELCMF